MSNNRNANNYTEHHHCFTDCGLDCDQFKDASVHHLDEIAEEIFYTYGSLGLIVWYKIQNFENFKEVKLPDELLLLLIECCYKGLKKDINQTNLFLFLIERIPSTQTLRMYINPQSIMEGALFYICAMLHLIHSREFKLPNQEFIENLFADFLIANSQSFISQVLAILGLRKH